MLARTHQADNLAKLRQEFLSLLELIAKIFCAVVIARTSAVLSNKLSFVASTATPFEQLDEERENAPRTATLAYSSVRELV